MGDNRRGLSRAKMAEFKVSERFRGLGTGESSGREGSRATFAACTRERQRFASSPRLFLSLSSLSSPGRSMMIGSRVLDSREGGRFPLLRLSVLLGEQELLTSLFSLPLPFSRSITNPKSWDATCPPRATLAHPCSA